MNITLTLSAQKRDEAKKSARDARLAGHVPAVVYGCGKDPISLTLNASDILKAFRKASHSGIIELDIDGKKETVLIHDVQVHPVRVEIQHVDFLRVEAGKKTKVRIPLRFEGESNAVKTYGAVFMIMHRHLPVECLPKDILPEIVVDKSVLKRKGARVHIKDLGIDFDKFRVVRYNQDVIICSVSGKTKQLSDDDKTSEEVAAE